MYQLKEKCVDKDVLLLEFLIDSYSIKDKVLKKLLTNKMVYVNGKCETKFNKQLKTGDKILLIEKSICYKKIVIPIIYEDDDLVIVDKPSGILSISDLKKDGVTLFELVSNYVKEKNKGNKIFIVHRLDYDTSGLIIFSKSIKVKKILQDNWNDVKRGYVALLEGLLEKESGTVTSYLSETKTHLVYSSSKGKKAITHYFLIRKVKGNSLVQIYIDTGRKNQIRVHMKDINHPIVGDKKYGSGGKRFCLCANVLEFYHPVKKDFIKLHIHCDFE